MNKNFDVIINLSGYVNHSDKKKTFQTHYYGCQNLANIFLEKIKNLFKLEVVGNGNIRSPQKEKEICKPLTNYALAKYKSSSYLLNLIKKIPSSYSTPVPSLWSKTRFK